MNKFITDQDRVRGNRIEYCPDCGAKLVGDKKPYPPDNNGARLLRKVCNNCGAKLWIRQPPQLIESIEHGMRYQV
jgi:hypothetical protein